VNKKTIITLAAVGVGAYVIYRMTQKPAAPQPVQGDMGAFWDQLSKGVSKVTKQVVKPVTKLVPMSVQKPVIKLGVAITKPIHTTPVKNITKGAGAVALAVGTLGVSLLLSSQREAITKSLGIKKPILKGTSFGKKHSLFSGTRQKAGGEGTEEVYMDENGNQISKAEYDRLMAQYEAEAKAANEDVTPIYQDEYGNVITKEQYDAAMAAYVASMQADMQPAQQTVQTTSPTPADVAVPQTISYSGGSSRSSYNASEYGEPGAAESDEYTDAKTMLLQARNAPTSAPEIFNTTTPEPEPVEEKKSSTGLIIGGGLAAAAAALFALK